MFDCIVHCANDAILVAELNPAAGGFHIVYVNEAFTRIFGYTAEELVGRSPRILQGPETCAETIKEISTAVHRELSIRRQILNYTKEGQKIWVDANIVPLPSAAAQPARFAAIERDVTIEVLREQQLEELAFGDPLTRLPNRRYFDQILDREMSRTLRSGEPLSLAIIDIDHFKVVNDTWGHPVGDRMLVAVARAMLQGVRNYDYIARIGGEEFTVLLPGARLDDALRVVERLCAGVRSHAQVIVGARTIGVTCSAGVNSTDAAVETAPELLAGADRALYTAKNSGRNRVVGFDPGTTLIASAAASLPEAAGDGELARRQGGVHA